MSPYERVASRLIGTPLQRPAEWLRDLRGRASRRAHPELAEWFMEGERTEQVLRRIVSRETNCIDIGCHIGSFLQRLVTMAPAGRHYAVEPVPDKAARLRRKFRGVEVLEVALGDSNGSAEFFVDPQQSSYSGLMRRSHSTRTESLVVARRTLDGLIPDKAGIGFIKIDVNGAELKVLRGALGLLHRDRPFVLLECTRDGLDDYGVDSDQVFSLLTNEAGYSLQLLKEFLGGGPVLDASGFRRSMQYPFQAFNFAAAPSRPRA